MSKLIINNVIVSCLIAIMNHDSSIIYSFSSGI